MNSRVIVMIPVNPFSGIITKLRLITYDQNFFKSKKLSCYQVSNGSIS